MTITMTFVVEFDRTKETLKGFGDKLIKFKAHVLRMQVAGRLPMGAIKWVARKKGSPAPIDDVGETRAVLLPHEISRPLHGPPAVFNSAPRLIHRGGTALDQGLVL